MLCGCLQCGPEAVTGLWPHDPNAGEKHTGWGWGLTVKGFEDGKVLVTPFRSPPGGSVDPMPFPDGIGVRRPLGAFLGQIWASR